MFHAGIVDGLRIATRFGTGGRVVDLLPDVQKVYYVYGFLSHLVLYVIVWSGWVFVSSTELKVRAGGKKIFAA